MLKQEFGDDLLIDWRAYMLMPEAKWRQLESFRKYTRHWLQAADEPDAGKFQMWGSDESPPSHSLPPHKVAKAAASVSEEAFERIHDSLLKAYFFESRDISNADVLKDLWQGVGLSVDDLAIAERPEIEEEIINEHKEAVACGASGAPSFRTADNDTALTGAHPMPLLRRWVNRALARQ